MPYLTKSDRLSDDFDRHLRLRLVVTQRNISRLNSLIIIWMIDYHYLSVADIFHSLVR